MGMKEMIQDFMERRREEQEEIDSLPDDVTRDRVLRSLRREKRVMDEEQEKIMLRKILEKRKLERVKKHLFGVGNSEMMPRDALLQKKARQKKVNVLANSLKKPLLSTSSTLNNRKDEFRKTKSHKTGMIGRGNIL